MGDPFKYELTKLSNTHNAVADWLIANPGKGQLGRCAAHFGYTRSWLSTLVQQDAFRALMQIKQGKAFEEVVIPLQDKIAGVAHASVEKLGEIIEKTDDERLVREIGKDMLNSLGYGASAKPAGVVNNTQVNLTVDAGALAEARNRQSKHYGRVLESSSEPDAEAPEAEAPKLSYSEEPGMGQTRELRAEHVNGEKAIYREPTEGGEV